MKIFKEIADLVWIILPAYVANGAPVVGVKVLDSIGYKRHPIDRGKNFVDGKRIFGDNKTWEGFFIGVATGILVGLTQSYLVNDFLYFLRGATLSVGAMLGDLMGAFVKRRLSINPGDPLPLVDQTLFLFVAVSIALVLNLIKLTPKELLILTIITVFLHYSTNFIAYKLRLKKVPW